MLILIVFWLAIALSLISWIGAITESSTTLAWASVLFCALALCAGVLRYAPWL